MSRGLDSNTASNVSATTVAFTLRGGLYMIIISATFGGGNVVLQTLAADGVTYVNVHTAITAAGVANVTLPNGQYRWAVTTAIAVYASVVGIPGD